MKHVFNLLIILQLSVLFSCSNDSLLKEDSNQPSLKMENDSIQTLGYCYTCLPMITAYHDPVFNEFVIAWSGFRENSISHPVAISYKVDGRSGGKSIGENNGEIRQKVYSNTYFATWSIKCSADNCFSCNKSGSLLKKESGETETGKLNDCYKEYLSYSVEKVYNLSNTYDFVLNNYDEYLNNTEKYMTIDDVKTYKIDSYTGFEQEISHGASFDMSLAPFRLRLYIRSQDMNKNFKIKFFSSKCKYNQDHYLFTSYRFDGFGAQMSTSLTLVKH